MNATPSQTRLRIAIATLGRFHVLDLARELSAAGHDVRFYSYVPRRRAERFGLPAGCHVSLLVILWPLVILARSLNGRRSRRWLHPVIHWAANVAVTWRLKPCDVFICMSGIYLEAAAAAKQRYGARVVVERGSMHIDAQQDILNRIRMLEPAASIALQWDVQRERAGYTQADSIVVPSRHAEHSFLERGFSRSKVARIPYGVNLDMFYPAPEVARSKTLIVFAGNWSYQKGVDILMNAVDQLGLADVQLSHLGSAGDAPFPQRNWFTHVGHVDQSELRAWYQRASVLVLPSRQEGLSLVLGQALACGCPVIGSENSGAQDLKEMDGLTEWVDVVPCEEVDALRDAILRRLQAGRASSAPRIKESLSWTRYGEEYVQMLAKLCPAPRIG